MSAELLLPLLISVQKNTKNAKIPDVAKKFGVNVKNLYYMMRELNFKL